MVTKKQVVDAIVAVAYGFVPAPFRWAVRVVADLFASRLGFKDAEPKPESGPFVSAAALAASSPDELKNLINSLFDDLIASLSGRPFMKSIVTAVRDFVVSNLLDAIWDQLFAKGERAAAGAVPAAFTVDGTNAFKSAVESAVMVGDAGDVTV